ncbi:MAG TPA: GNAT family protein [Thermoleophilaceae bacterium]
MTRIVGDRVTLRGFRDDELDRLVEVATAAPTDDGIHWGPTDRASIRQRIASSGVWSHGHLILAIEADGELVGEVQARSVRGGMPTGVFELGIDVFDPAERGRGLGSAAVVELTRHLFLEEAAHRVQLSTDVANAPMRRVAERLGFGFEGVMRGFMPTGDGPHDYALYAITKDDYEDMETRWT